MHGSCMNPPMQVLRFGVDYETVDKMCCFNRKFAEQPGYAFITPRTWLEALASVGDTRVIYFDSVSGKPIFCAPIGRTQGELLKESKRHGWPSFRDAEVIWENVRILEHTGEVVSTSGTHLGHYLPDKKGNRYCINLCAISGSPPDDPHVPEGAREQYLER